MKSAVLISVFFLLGCRVFSQDTTRHDPSLRLTLTLVDSIGIPFQLNDSTVKTIYKFKIDSIYRGVYRYPYIYVTAVETIMRHFNTFLNVGVMYWWGVMDTKQWYKGMPVYRHSSSW